jgi:hypothetical protein
VIDIVVSINELLMHVPFGDRALLILLTLAMLALTRLTEVVRCLPP